MALEQSEEEEERVVEEGEKDLKNQRYEGHVSGRTGSFVMDLDFSSTFQEAHATRIL